jgi:hypothetical protein
MSELDEWLEYLSECAGMLVSFSFLNRSDLNLVGEYFIRPVVISPMLEF